jgi:hypothetical protein
MPHLSDPRHGQLVEELLRRQDEALARLDELSERVETAIAEINAGRAGNNTGGPGADWLAGNPAASA